MPINIQHTKLASDLVALEDLQWHDSGIAEHVARNAAVEYLQRTIVTGVCK